MLLVIDQFPQALGGGERIALKIASLLPQYGYRASILTFSVASENTLAACAPCPIYILPLEKTYDLTAFRAAWELKPFLRAQRIKLVHTFFESSDLWAGLVTKIASNAKLVWSRRDMGILRQRKHRLAYRLLAGMPDAVFAVSEQVRRSCIAGDRIPQDRVETIYNGLDLSQWRLSPDRGPLKQPGQKIRITTVGNIRRVKGHDLLLAAAAVVVKQYSDTLFTIAGEILEPDYFQELQQQIRDLDLAAHVQFLGNLSNLQAHLSCASIFVLPSRSEGFSNAILEAMAASLPVVATDVGGNSEAVQNGITGFLVPPENPSEIASALMRLVSDPSLAEDMGRRGRDLVTARFTTETMMARISKTFDRLLSQTSRPTESD